MAALSFLLFFSSIIPLLGAFALLLCPVPMVVMVLRHGMRRALQSLACATALVAMLGGGPVQAYAYLVSSGLVGVITGWMLTRQTTPGRAFVQGALVLSLALAPSALILERSVGADGKYADFEKMMLERFQQNLVANATTPEQQLMVHKQMQFVRDSMATLIICPIGGFVLISFFSLFVGHFVAWRVLEKLAMPVRPPPDPRNLRAPEWAAAALMILLVLFGYVGGPARTLPASLVLNCLAFLPIVLWLAGVAAAARAFSPGYPLPAGRFVMLGVFLAFLGGIPILFALAESLMARAAPPASGETPEAPPPAAPAP